MTKRPFKPTEISPEEANELVASLSGEIKEKGLSDETINRLDSLTSQDIQQILLELEGGSEEKEEIPEEAQVEQSRPTDFLDIESIKREAANQKSEKPRKKKDIEIKKRQEKLAIDRRNFLKAILAGGIIVGLGATGAIIHSILRPNAGLSTPEMNFDKLGSEIYRPKHEFLIGEVADAIDEAIEKGSKWDELYTRNCLSQTVYENQIKEHLVKRRVNGHEMIAKKPVMDRFEAAWGVLAEFGIEFEGPSSHFRRNSKQFDINKDQPPDLFAGSTTGSYHLAGQSIDVPQMGMKKMGPDGNKIKEVLKIFGFKWGIKGSRLKWNDKVSVGIDDAKRILGDFIQGKTDIKEGAKRLKESYETEDRVHFQMTNDDLEDALSIEDAIVKAREFLEKKVKNK